MARQRCGTELLTGWRTECKHLVMVESSEWTAIQQVVDRLKAIYPAVPPDTVTTVVHHNHARFNGRPVRDFVPLFVERDSRRELAKLAS
jgi:hypothetical protein